MAEIDDLDVTDANNTDRFPENMPPSDVNNSGRALEGILARWHNDINGSTITTGSANAYVFAANQTLSAYYDGMDITFDANFTNTDAATLNVDSLGAKSILKNNDVALASGDIEAGQKVRVIYDGTSFQMMSPVATTTDASGGLSNVVEDATPQLGGTLDSNSKQIRWSKGADVASANLLVLGDDGNYFDVTGTTTINQIATKAIGTVVKLHFDGILTLTHNASDFVLPGAANITTAANDEAEFVEYATGDWRCTNYSKAEGTIYANSSEAIKGWVTFDGTAGSLSADASFNHTSLTDNGTGDYTWTFDTDMASVNYVVIGTSGEATLGLAAVEIISKTVTAVRILTWLGTTSAHSSNDAEIVDLAILGVQ